MTTIRRLRYFLSAARMENFAEAAVAVNITQPALSRHMRDLEIALGFDLFDRVGRGVRLSSAGRRYAHHVQEALEALDRGTREARLLVRRDDDPIRVGIQEFAGLRSTVVKTLDMLRHLHSRRTITLSPMTSIAQARALETGELDVGFLYSWALTNRLDGITVDNDHWQLVVGRNHRLAAAPAVRLRDLADENFVMIDPIFAPPLFSELADECRRRGLHPNIVHRVPNASALCTLVATEGVVGFVTQFSNVGDGVAVLELEDLPNAIPLQLAWNRDTKQDYILDTIRAMEDGRGSDDRA